MNENVDEIVGQVAKRLRSYGMPRDEVAGMVSDLRLEIHAAISNGGSSRDIIGGDARRFTQQLAVSAGFHPVPSRFVGLAVATALPLSLIAFFVYVVVLGGGPTLGLPEMRASVDRNSSNEEFLDRFGEGWFVAAAYVAAAAIGVILTLAAAAGYLAMWGDRCIAITIRNMLVALPIGGTIGVAAAVLVGAATNYSDDATTIIAECLVVAFAVLAALWLSRTLARGLSVPRPRIRPFANRES